MTSPASSSRPATAPASGGTPATITFLSAPDVQGSKTWTPVSSSDYASPLGPFAVVRVQVNTLDDLERALRTCPFNAYAIRGVPIDPNATTIPYRRIKAKGLEPPSLRSEPTRWVAVDFDEKAAPDAPPRPDLPHAAAQARSVLPAPFNSLPCVAQATASAGIKPGVRVRLHYLLDAPRTDAELSALFEGTPGVDTSVFDAWQPIYVASPRFLGRPDPIADRFVRLPECAPALPAPVPELTKEQAVAQALQGLNEHKEDTAPLIEGERNRRLASIAGSMRARGASRNEILAALKVRNAEQCKPPLPEDDLSGIADSISTYEPSAVPVVSKPDATNRLALRDLRTQCSRLHDDPANLVDAAVRIKHHIVDAALSETQVVTRFMKALNEGALERSETQALTKEVVQQALRAAPALAQNERPAWQVNLLTNPEGGIRVSPENLRVILTESPYFQLWYDTRHEQVEWLQRPWGGPGAMSDSDDFRLRCWLDKEMGWPKCPTSPIDAITSAAMLRPHDPWEAYLRALQWDGVPRLVQAAGQLLGATERHEAMFFAWWLISAVARSFEPGCQVDHVIVLEGSQGLGKSSFLQTLVGHPRYYARVASSGDLNNPRVVAKLQGPVVIELAELAAIASRDTESSKEFIDCREDKWIPPYGRVQRVSPRKCVFAGTTNRSDYLHDSTGARRFWPIQCNTINLELLAQVRDQLWAEAVAARLAGTKWWPTPEETAALGLASAQEERRVEEVGEESLLALFERTWVPDSRDGLALKPPAERWMLDEKGTLMRAPTHWFLEHLGWSDKDSRTVSRALRAVGLVKQQSRHGGVKVRYWGKK